MRIHPTAARTTARLLIGAAVLAALACTGDRLVQPGNRIQPREASVARSATALAVTSTSPAFGDQGTTVDVHILGTGFTAGAQASWLLNGVPDNHVRTNGTTVVSSTELVANITIAADAQLAFWDVQVALSNGKNGVGSDVFEVTSARIAGPGTTGGDASVYGISEQGQLVGYAATAFVYDDAGGMIDLGSGQGRAIDPFGTLAGGFSSLGPTAWTRQSASSWVPQQMPQLPHSVGATFTAAARASDGTLIAAGLDDSSDVPCCSTDGANRPVVWRLVDGTWTAPQRYALPTGAVRGSATDINGLGQMVGSIDGQLTGAVWDDSNTPVRLDGLPIAINPAGTIVVGRRTSQNQSVPVYWWRDPATHAWHTVGVPLPSVAGGKCHASASDINGAGVVVGASCSGTGQQATVWHLDFSGASPVLASGPTGLPGLGVRGTSSSDISAASAVTEGWPYTVGGTAKSNGTRLAVRWTVQ